MALRPDCDTYTCVTREEAKAQGFHPVTSPYGIRRHAQKAMLDSAIAGMKGLTFVLVRKGETITIWRK